MKLIIKLAFNLKFLFNFNFIKGLNKFKFSGNLLILYFLNDFETGQVFSYYKLY